MCGISGVLHNGKIEQKDLMEPVETMVRFQKRRGPDDEGSFFYSSNKNSVCLGNDRLSIIDTSSKGHQPMVWKRGRKKGAVGENGQLVITFNGEIYNFKELRAELIKDGYKFETNSDTEVILALFDKYGTESFLKLRGMFAFGLWDEKAEKLYLVRDHFGIKPLYYYQDKEKTIFASTVGAIKNCGLVKPEKNESARALFLLFGSIPEPYTTEKNIQMLPAGHYLEIGVNDYGKITRYYDLLEYFINKKNVSLYEAAKTTREILQESVMAHMISDAPLGAFLSGGVDSSTIAVLAAKSRNEPISTLSIDFDEKEFSEKKYQDIIQKQIRSNHKRVVVTKDDFLKSLGEAFEAMDQPTIDGVNTFFVSKVAHDVGLKVVLSGLGSDEIFFGYSGFRKFPKILRVARMPKITKFWLFLASLLGGKYVKLSYLKHSDLLRFYLVLRGLFTTAEVSKMLDIPVKEVDGIIDEYLKISVCSDARLLQLDPADAYSYLELNLYMRNQLLKDTDFMSMYHSVEVRVPFVDVELINYVAGLTPEIKFAGDNNKGLLIRAMKDVLPKEIYNRKKMGFLFPLEKWADQPSVKDTLPIKGHWSRLWAMTVLKKAKLWEK